MSEMDKAWMHSDRRSKAYEFGVEAFLNFAVENLFSINAKRYNIGYHWNRVNVENTNIKSTANFASFFESQKPV